MLNKRIINTGGGGAACTTDTTQILDAGTTESLALYRFEDNAFDTSNSTGYINKGAVFNGSSSKINLTAGSFTYTSQFSITAWIKLKSTQANQTILENYDYLSSTSRGFNFRVHTGDKLKFDGYYSDATRTDALSSTSIPLNTWTHVAAVYNSTNSSIKLYINGSEVSYTTQTYNAMQYHSNCAVNIGALTYGTGSGAGSNDQQWFNGHIDELRVYDDALTATEIGYIANNTTASIPTGNLVALYSFEGNANDSTAYPINGTASNVIYDYSGTASNVTYATGKFGKAAVFNGSNSYIYAANSVQQPTTNFSVSVWVYLDSNSSNGYGIVGNFQSVSSGSQKGWVIARSSADTKFSFWADGTANSNGGKVVGTTVIQTGVWYHVVGTYDGTNVKIYVNGILENSVAYSSTPGTTNQPLVIGRWYGNFNDYYTDGKIDQVRIFDSALSPDQINSLYNETTTSAASASIDNPSTIAYYKMADATDETGSYNGTASNVDFNVQGKYGFAGKFNGSSSRINTGYQIPSGLAGFSVSAWVKAASVKTQYIVGDLGTNGASADGMFQINISSLNVLRAAVGGTGSQNIATLSNYIDTWTHIVVTTNSSGNIIGYVNGSQIGTASGNSLSANTKDLIIGMFGDLNHSSTFNGSIDQVRIFNKTISADEVTKLYNEIQCPNTIDTPESYFNTKLYTGNSTSGTSITGVGFKPDLTWIKTRNNAYYHFLHDSVRLVQSDYYLVSSDNNAQGSGAEANQRISSFDVDGFTISGTGNLSNLNANSNNYVSWNWKAGSSNVTNNDGSITSTVSASQESGFSIVKYTAGSSMALTEAVGHGLSQAPQMIIQKRLDSSPSNWYVIFTAVDGSIDYMNLNTTSAKTDMDTVNSGQYANFTIGNTGFSDWWGGSYNIINYCFHSVDGYQRIGSYIGNGSSTNGTFVFTGFEPAWVIIKQIDGANHWVIKDNKRSTSNPREERLKANQNNIEDTGADVNFFTNGFQIASASNEVNSNNNKYLFLAIAANPDTTEPTKANSFDTVLYNGTGGSQQITQVGFKPDLVWIKNRGTTNAGVIQDSVRGANNYIMPHSTNAENSSTSFVSFDATGFSLTGNGGSWNNSASNYVSWNWKGLDHDRNLTTINTDGSITSQVSANQNAGFSIVKYTGNGSTNQTIGNGLTGTVDLLIVRRVNTTGNWTVWERNATSGNGKYLRLQSADGLLGPGAIWDSADTTTMPTIGLFNVNNNSAVNGNGDDYIAYCWHSCAGYSKIGTYTGSGVSGKEVTLDFNPSFVLIKRTNASTGWIIVDNQRDTKELYANLSNAEDTTTTNIVLGTNKFTLNTTGSWYNASGGTYIYMAFK